MVAQSSLIIPFYHPLPSGTESPQIPPEDKAQKIYTEVLEASLAKNAADGKKKWFFDDSYMPGVMGLFTAPLKFIELWMSYATAAARNDKEAQADILLRLSTLPLGCIYTSTSLASTLVQFLSFFNLKNLSPLRAFSPFITSALNAFGLVLSVIEFALEIFGLYKDGKFLSLIKGCDEDDKSIKAALLNLKERYFSLSMDELQILVNITEKKGYTGRSAIDLGAKWLQTKESELAHRIRPWAVQKLKDKISEGLLENLEGPGKIQEARELLNILRVQSEKKILVHAIGLIGIAFSIAALGLMLATCPWAIPISLAILCIIFSIGRILIADGTLDQEGWRFSFSDCIPKWMKQGWEKITRLAKGVLACHPSYPEGQKYPNMQDLQVKDHHHKKATDFPVSRLSCPQPSVHCQDSLVSCT